MRVPEASWTWARPPPLRPQAGPLRAPGAGGQEPRPGWGASITRGRGVSESRRLERGALSALARLGPFPPSRPAGAASVTGRSCLIDRPRQGLGPRGRRDGAEAGPPTPPLPLSTTRPNAPGLSPPRDFTPPG